MQTPDGAWRVEVVRQPNGECWYRIVNRENMIGWLAIAQVGRILDAPRAGAV